MFSHKIFRACKRAADSFHTVQFMHIAHIQYTSGYVLFGIPCVIEIKIQECLIVFGEHYYFTSLAIGPQRVLNDLKRTRLSRRRMIWLLPHPSYRKTEKVRRERG
jgi:hypothetical protein